GLAHQRETYLYCHCPWYGGSGPYHRDPLMRLLLLWLMSGSLWVDVPFVKQEKSGCGSASVWMILQYWNAGSVPPVEEIHHDLYSAEVEGVYARDIERYFRSRD